jgi:hypothetical protein
MREAGSRWWRDDSQRISSRPLRYFHLFLCACELPALPAVILGFAKSHHCPVWPEGRVLLIPAGAALFAHSILMWRRLLPRTVDMAPLRLKTTAAGTGAAGLAGVASGLERATHDSIFLLLALPASIAIGVGGLVLLVRGRAVITDEMREDSWVWRAPRALGAFGVLGGVVCTLAAVGAIHLGESACG